MRLAYWTREIAGWLLIAAGLYAFWGAYLFLLDRKVFEAGPMAFIGFVVFRGGIHILKVAVAAQAARSLPEAALPAVRRFGRAPARPIGPTPPESVLPGRQSSRGTVARR